MLLLCHLFSDKKVKPLRQRLGLGAHKLLLCHNMQMLRNAWLLRLLLSKNDGHLSLLLLLLAPVSGRALVLLLSSDGHLSLLLLLPLLLLPLALVSGRALVLLLSSDGQLSLLPLQIAALQRVQDNMTTRPVK